MVDRMAPVTLDALMGYLFSFVSYRVVSICLLSVPFTHFMGLYLRFPKHSPHWKYWLFPFKGGNRHIVLQLMSWLLWVFSLLTFLPVAVSMLPGSYRVKDLPTIPRTHVDVVSGAAACISFIGEVFMIKAILVFDCHRTAAQLAEETTSKFQPRPVLASAVVVIMGLLLSVTGFLLLMTLEYLPDIASRVLYCCLSLSCLLIASSTTYGLGGFLRYGASKGSAGADDGMWQFFQPFAGGTAFVTTQAISWSIFAATVVMLVVFIQQLVAGVAHCFRCWAIGAGTCMVAAQAMLGISLLLFRSPKSTAAKLVLSASRRLSLTGHSDTKQSWLGANLPIILMYSPVHVFFTLWVLSFMFMPLHGALTIWTAFLLPYYVFTQMGNPAHTGCRQWPWLMNWFANNIEGSLRHWFGSLTVVYDGDAAQAAAAAAKSSVSDIGQTDGSTNAACIHVTERQDQQAAETAVAAAEQDQEDQQQKQSTERFMFGFQPHGLYPTGAGFLPWMPSFKKHFPHQSPVTLTATVIFFPPFIRDICCWAGFRQVSKHTFLSALREKGSVIFCPGGQAELVHAWKAFVPGPNRQVVLNTRHKGFCRIAIEQQAALVPVLALGETLQLKNLINLPSLQQATYRKLGFPVPFVLSGRWFLTPFPRKTPLVYILGKPLHPPAVVPGQTVVASAVDELHKQYYSSLVDLFDRYKHLHPDYVDARVLLSDE